MKSWRRWASLFAVLGVMAALAAFALHQRSTPPEAQESSGTVPLQPVKAPAPSENPEPALSRAEPRAEPGGAAPAPLPSAPDPAPETSAGIGGSAEALMREIEQIYRSRPRAVKMEVVTTRVQSERVGGLPPYEELHLWGLVSGDPERTAVLYAFFSPRRYRGTGLMIEDVPGSRDGDTMWYHMRTFRRFQHIPQTSLRLLVAGTCMTYEDARGFLATDRYEFRFADPLASREARGTVAILARPLTPELENDTGYKSAEIRVDAQKRLVTEVRFTGLNGRPLKVYTAGEPVELGGSWFPGVARIEDLQSSVVSEIKYTYQLLVSGPPSALYDTTVEDLPLLERLTDALASEGIEAEDPAPSGM